MTWPCPDCREPFTFDHLCPVLRARLSQEDAQLTWPFLARLLILELEAAQVTDKPKPVRDPGKTLAMHLLEQQHGKSIEELIAKGEIADVGEALGIDRTTVSKWRKRLGVRTVSGRPGWPRAMSHRDLRE